MHEIASSWTLHAEVGDALVWHLSNSGQWHHRRVESHRLIDGPRSRRRVSIDLTLPNDGRLVVTSRLGGAERELMVPLALVKKARLQDFDAVIGGDALVIGDTTLNGSASLELLRASWRFDLGRDADAEELDLMRRIVFRHDFDDEDSIAGELIELATRRGFAEHLSDFTRVMLGALEYGFLLVGLVPAELAGGHVLVKYSEHWELSTADRTQVLGRWAWLTAACGWRSCAFEIEMNDAGLLPKSFHVEVHAPAALISERLLLEGGSEGGIAPPSVLALDHRRGVVSHVVTSGAHRPRRAYAYLGVKPAGLLGRAAVAYSASAALFVAASIGPLTESAFDSSARSAASLFLAVVAVVLGVTSREAENPVSARLLLPLRVLVFTLAGLYFLVAAAIATGFGAGPGGVLVRAVASATVLGAVLVGGGYLRCRWRQVQQGRPANEER